MNQIETILTKNNIPILYIPNTKLIYLTPQNKPDTMTFTQFQLLLKRVSLHNQDNKCVCGDILKNQGELHHAIFTRQDVRGSRRAKNLIHHVYNVIVECKQCHASATRKESVNFLCGLYGEDSIKNWYNNFPLVSKKVKFEWYIK